MDPQRRRADAGERRAEEAAAASVPAAVALDEVRFEEFERALEREIGRCLVV